MTSPTTPSPTIRRFSSADIRAAYDATGYRPIRGTWGPIHRRNTDNTPVVEACPLLTLAKAKDPSRELSFPDLEVNEVLDIDLHYSIGFIRGWDDGDIPESVVDELHWPESRRLGYIDGFTARAAFAAEGIEVPEREEDDDEDDDDDDEDEDWGDIEEDDLDLDDDEDEEDSIDDE